MARRKRDYDWEAILRPVRKLREMPGPWKTVEELAKELCVNKARLAEEMKKAGIPTARQRLPESRFQNRVDRTPVIDVVGIHMQGNQLNRVAAVAIADRGFPQTRTASKQTDLKQMVLAPSFLSTDARRAWNFEVNFAALMDVLDDHRDSKIDEALFLAALKDLAEFGRQHGYDVEIAVCLEGRIPDSMKKMTEAIPGCFIPEWPIRELMVHLAVLPFVSYLGAGRMPLLGCTVERLKSALIQAGTMPIKQFDLRWTPDDIDLAIQGRLRVCDALGEAGLLYGAPLNKVAEMAAEARSSFSRAIVKKQTDYGDGLHSEAEQRPKRFVQLAVPTRLRSRYLSQIPLDLSDCRDQMDFRRVDIEGKNVECLVAWLPSLREMLLRILQSSELNHLLSKGINVQQEAVEALRSHPFQRCLEILNPEGVMSVDILRDGLAALTNTDYGNLVLGMLLSAYDPDSLIGSMMSLADWQQCRQWQENWNERVITEAARHRETITARVKWDDRSEAAEQLNADLALSSRKGHRLIRFIIEEAAVNYAQAFQRAANRLEINFFTNGWPEEPLLLQKAIPILLEETSNLWPVVGVRMDFFVARQASLLRRHLGGEWSEQREEGWVEYREDFAQHNNPEREDDMSADHDPFEDNGE